MDIVIALTNNYLLQLGVLADRNFAIERQFYFKRSIRNL